MNFIKIFDSKFNNFEKLARLFYKKQSSWLNDLVIKYLKPVKKTNNQWDCQNLIMKINYNRIWNYPKEKFLKVAL